MTELSIHDLDEVAGGEFITKCWDVPGGSVCRTESGTSMQFGGVTITIYPGGAITTSGTSTTTRPPA